MKNRVLKNMVFLGVGLLALSIPMSTDASGTKQAKAAHP